MLEKLFNPKSISVVGASRDREKVGNIVLRNVMSTFNGKIYPVNQSADAVEGIKAYKSLKEIGDVPDLAIVAVPREAVPGIMEMAGEIGTKSAIIITSGFKEVDERGAELQKQIDSLASKYGIRYLGPNTLGIITPYYNGTFALTDIKRGNIAVVAQSGGIGIYMLDWAHRTRTGLSYFVSLGNEANITETDIYEYLSNDFSTRAVFSYVEGVADGVRFINEVPGIVERKPLVFLKGGTGGKGSQAVKTHTASVAGSVDVFRAAIRSVGGIYVDTLEDMLNIAKIITSNEVIKKDLLIVTNSGGHGVLATDETDRLSINLIDIPDIVQQELRKVLPDQSKPSNPLDLSGDADSKRYRAALKAVQDLDCTKMVIVEALPMASCMEIARVLLDFKGKSVIGVMMGMDEDAAVRLLESANVPAFRFPEDAVRAINYFNRMSHPVKRIRISQPIMEAQALTRGKSYLKDFEAFKLLEMYGVMVPPWGTATSIYEARKIGDQIGYPVVMKLSLDEPGHKTEMGGVIVGVDKDGIDGAFSELVKRSPRILIQKQIDGAELFLGGLDDPVFGPTSVVGIGGVYVEVLKSLSYGLCPVSEDEAYFMLNESRAHQMLNSRGKAYDENSVISTITKVSRLIVDLGVKEMDINPLIVNEAGAYAVDPRIVLKQ